MTLTLQVVKVSVYNNIMAKKCKLRPEVVEGITSPLYSQLENFFGNRKDAMFWYTRAKSVDFQKKFPSVRQDKYGEPLFDDLLNKIGISKLKGESETLSMLNREIGHTQNGKIVLQPKDYGHVAELQEQAVRFNNNSPFRDKYFATVEEAYEGKNSGATIIVKPNREKKNSEPQRLAVNYSLNKKLEGLLNSWGIGIGALTNLEERLGVNGVMDLSVAMDAATGLRQVIRLAKGEEGQAALPEEFAHFAIEAMGENPIKTRAINSLTNEEALRRILGTDYDNYSAKYNGDLRMLAEEALGKMVAKALVNNDIYSPSPSLFQRFLTSLKNFFSRFNGSDIDAIVQQVQNEANQIAQDITTGKFNLRVNSPQYNRQFYSLTSKVDRDVNLLNRIIEQELKRLKIYGKKEDFNAAQQAYIEELNQSIAENQALEGIYKYIQTSLGVLEKLQGRLSTVMDMDAPLNEKMSALRNIRNYMSSYGSIILEIRKDMNAASAEGDNRFKDKLRNLLDQNTVIIQDLSADFYDVSKSLFADYIRPFVGEGLSITIARDKYKKTYTAEELVTSMDRDITFFDRWIDSMADSSDPMLQIYDQVVKKQKGLARLDTIEMQKSIETAAKKLELAGIKNTDWMYEKDANGVPTGYFVQPVDWAAYRAEKKKFNDYLKKKYGENPEGENLLDRSREIAIWYAENSSRDEHNNIIPSMSKYRSSAFASLNSAQKEYYRFIMDLKAKLDNILPHEYTKVNKAPQIRRDFLQRMLGSGNKAQYFWETMKDSLVRREDDVDVQYKDDKSVLMDFEGNPVNKLPIYYTRQLEDMRDLSLDSTSSMIAYASMVNDFNRMNEVLDTLEVGRLVLAERKVADLEGDKRRVEGFKILGREVHNLLTKNGSKSLFMDKLNSFMEMQVYGRYMKDSGTIGESKIDTNKAVALLMKMTSYSTTALSLLTGTANMLQNFATSNIEAASGRFFNHLELAYADKEYGAHLPAYLAEIGNRIKTSKIALFDELFNVQQDYKQSVRNVNWNKKTWATRLLGENAIFFTTQAGDHWTQNRIAIALADRFKLKDANGNNISLWNALEVVPIDGKNKSMGAKLQLKKGVTKENGSQFTKDDILAFSNRVRGIENNLYGIYNSEDRIAAKQLAVGRMAMMYRDWMRPLWLNRFGRGKYNFDLQDYTEGYYQTGYRFLKQMYKDIKQSEFDIISQWKELTPLEKGNIRKGLMEIGTYIGLTLLLGLLEEAGGDDEDKPWALRMAAYSALRLKSDIGVMLPSPTMLDESLKLLDDPTVIIPTLKKLRNVIKLFYPESYDEVIETGPYKGYTKAEKYIFDLLPFRKQVLNALDPDQPARWFKMDAR